MKITESPNFDAIQPSTCINARIRSLHRLLNSTYMAKFKTYGLGGSMLSILFIIGKNPNINQKSIADILVLDPSTMSRDLKKLIHKGWVIATKGEDPRNSELRLTEEGIILLEEVSPIWQKLHSKVEDILGSFNLQNLDIMTRALKENIGPLKE